jgi:hypothetical protein
VLVPVFALMTKVEALVLAEVMRDMRMSTSERVETEESCCHGHLGVRFGLGERGFEIKSCIMSLTDVGSRIKMTATMAVIMTGGEMS